MASVDIELRAKMILMILPFFVIYQLKINTKNLGYFVAFSFNKEYWTLMVKFPNIFKSKIQGRQYA